MTSPSFETLAATPQALPLMTRAYLWVAVGTAGVGAVLLAATAESRPGGLWAAGIFAALALLSLAATRVPDRRLSTAVVGIFGAAVLAVGAATVLLGWGLRAPALPLDGLVVCMASLAAGWRAGVLLASLGVAEVLLLAGLAPGPPAGLGAPPSAVLLGTHLASILAGLASGALASGVMQRYATSAQEREHRFRRLLALAADAYWETDAEHRVLAAAGASASEALPRMTAATGLGRVFWTLPQFGCDAETLDTLRADMEARRPFRDLPVRWTFASGRSHDFLSSGEPRFDERGNFTGYWGVVRDVTAVKLAQQALAATETRYQDLFAHVPSPLLLHRDGRVLDANPAAVAFFGHATLAEMLGSELPQYFEPGESRERVASRSQHVQHQAPGSALPVAGYRLRVKGRSVSVRATGVRIDTPTGPAVLSIFIDDTGRLTAEEALRRSEAMLSNVVATSPDVITLTELESGRYVIVNPSFERLSGWRADEVVGRTAAEIGIWADAAERLAFVAEVKARGLAADLPMRFIARDGHDIPLRASAARFAMEGLDYLVISGRDVSSTQRQQLEREAILANASVGIAVTRHRRFELSNPHFDQLYGWAPGELLGQPGSVVWASEEDYASLGREVGPTLARGEAIAVQRQARRKDGSSFLAFVRGRAVDPLRPADGGTVWIIEDITERHAAEQALAAARDAAEAANRAKSAFLANTSHELRTPLNGMIGLARLARDDATDATRRRQYLDQIVESAQSLAGIISDILDLSKIEAGKLQLEAAPFDLDALLQTLQRTYATLADARGLTLTLQATPPLGAVSGDALRLRQILSNFLGNAVKFTGSGGVVLCARRLGGGAAGAQSAADDRVRFEVQDSGPGIAGDVQAALFEPFTQADQSTTRRFGGTGLGLSICRDLATLMQGRVGVHSEPGRGSTFWAELPLPPARLAAASPVPAVAARSLAGAHVLMVEDNAVNMMIAVALLEHWGVTVAQVVDGREALAAVQGAAATGRPFDAVLMDVQMPGMGGYEATRALRAAGQRLPVIALTAAALVSEREEALRAGMDDFLTKPIDADRLQATLARWCAPHPAGPGTPG
ncbi:MAG: PAS domain S-box protein [Rubrivivax sp.]|nr:PAS domain S-box protein [Rubrivivax sp.]